MNDLYLQQKSYNITLNQVKSSAKCNSYNQQAVKAMYYYVLSLPFHYGKAIKIKKAN